MAQILLVGTATLDIVYTLGQYPAEDEEVRADGLRVCRGGNAANTAVVLAQLGHKCGFAGVLAQAPETAVIEQDFLYHGVDFSACPRFPGRPPISSIQLTPASRTIVHYRDLPELDAKSIEQMDIAAYDWIHFEGRNAPQLLNMLKRVRGLRPDLPVSIELEKPREGIDIVLEWASLLICSRGFAGSRGYVEPKGFLRWLGGVSKGADVCVAWGEDGAFGLGRDGNFSHAPAFPPERVVDTLGAGDTFNAGLIDALVRGGSLSAGIEAGSRLAGIKCGINGFSLDLG